VIGRNVSALVAAQVVTKAVNLLIAVALVPHTLEATTLDELAPGDAVNLEVDILAKYVERLLPATL